MHKPPENEGAHVTTAGKEQTSAPDSDRHETGRDGLSADLIVVEQSGAKREFPQPSVHEGIVKAKDAVRRDGRHLREVKVVSRREAVARWKSDGRDWRRVA
jgi:hypothetical protein